MTTYATTRPHDVDAGRDRIVIDGVDVTGFRMSEPGDQPWQVPGYQLIEPFGYGPSQLTVPRFNAAYEKVSALPWARHGATVKYQRVYPGRVVTDYVGRVLALRIDGADLVLEVGGQVEGPAGLIHVPRPVFREVGNLSRWIGNATNPLGIRVDVEPTGIEIPDDGDMSLLAWLRHLCTMSLNTAGQQRALMPNPWGGTRWTFAFKNMTTKHATLFHDPTRVAVSVVDDAAETPNTWFGNGVDPDGGRWRNAKNPGQVPIDTVPKFPMPSGGVMTVGTHDDDTTSGSGVDTLRVRLSVFGYIQQVADGGFTYDPDPFGTYNATIADAVRLLQADAGLPVTGNTDAATWNAAFDLGVTGFSTTDARQHPIVQDRRVERWLHSANGSRIGHNPNFDPDLLRSDRVIDFGPGIRKSGARAWARGQHARLNTGKNWAGQIRLEGRFGGYKGGHDTPTGLTDADVMPFRDLRPGMNVWLPYFDGGTLFHISAIDVEENGATLHVDTKARDWLELSQLVERRKESRRDIRRDFIAHNFRQTPSVPEWDSELGGMLFEDWPLTANRWNWVKVTVGQVGQINRVNARLSVATEFVMCVTSRDVRGAMAATGDPFPVISDEPIWDRDETLHAWYEDGTLLYCAGHEKDPCGYGEWGLRSKFTEGGNRSSAALTGRHRDDANWTYECAPFKPTVLWVGIYPKADCRILSGRLFRHQEGDY